jgi:hypothetical protein
MGRHAERIQPDKQLGHIFALTQESVVLPPDYLGWNGARSRWPRPE